MRILVHGIIVNSLLKLLGIQSNFVYVGYPGNVNFVLIWVYLRVSTVLWFAAGKQSSLNCAAFVAGIIESVLTCSNFVSIANYCIANYCVTLCDQFVAFLLFIT
jgi:hypothetical protein